jgi:hypothetical protein
MCANCVFDALPGRVLAVLIEAALLATGSETAEACLQLERVSLHAALVVLQVLGAVFCAFNFTASANGCCVGVLRWY